MADVAFPSISEMGNLQFVDPSMYLQGMKQVDLASQFADANLKQKAADLQQQNLANMYKEQVNPLLVEQQRLTNTGEGFKNQSLGVKARTDVELEGESKAAKRAELLKSASEDDLKTLQAQAQAQMMRVDDPDAQARGKRMMDASYEEFKRREKIAAEQTKIETIVGGRKDVAELQHDARIRAAELALEGNKYGADVRARLAALKSNSDPKSLDQELARTMAATARATDPEQKQALQVYAQQIQNAIITQKQALAGTKVDVGKVSGLPTLGLPPIGPIPTIPGGGGNPPPMSGIPNVPAGAENPAEGLRRATIDLQNAKAARASVPSNQKQALSELDAHIKTLESDVANYRKATGATSTNSAPAVTSLPAGSKQIGTSGGKPVYQTPDGKKFIGE